MTKKGGSGMEAATVELLNDDPVQMGGKNGLSAFRF
jgi:hypothetical protein